MAEIPETTAQVGAEGDTCLQCIADGGTCCSLSKFNRWKEKS